MSFTSTHYTDKYVVSDHTIDSSPPPKPSNRWNPQSYNNFEGESPIGDPFWIQPWRRFVFGITSLRILILNNLFEQWKHKLPEQYPPSPTQDPVEVCTSSCLNTWWFGWQLFAKFLSYPTHPPSGFRRGQRNWKNTLGFRVSCQL